MVPPYRPCRLALVGLMGSGKSRVGTLLAAATGWPFVDADREIEGRAGRTVSQIFESLGEPGFREREAALLDELSRRTPPLVVATGGGVVEREESRGLLAGSFTTIWLDIEPLEAARRLGNARGRPLLLGGNPAEVMTALAARRNPLYEAVAHHRLSTGRATRAEDLRDGILDLLEPA